MAKVNVIEFVSLDGVIQAPGDPDEDPDGFDQGGWTRPFFGDHGRYMPAAYRAAGGFLFGRKTYEIFSNYWPNVTANDDDIAHALNTLPKYVVSRTLTDTAWPHTIVLRGSIADEVAALKRRPGRDILVIGSAQLAHTLITHSLIDEYQLWLHPIVLGRGKRLFANGDVVSRLRLVDSQTTASGVVILTYHPDSIGASP